MIGIARGGDALSGRGRGTGGWDASARRRRRSAGGAHCCLWLWPRSLLLILDREQERRGHPLDTSQKTSILSFLYVKLPEKMHVKILSDSTTKITIKIIVTKSKGILIYFEGPTRNEVSKSRLFDVHSQLPLPNNTCRGSYENRRAGFGPFLLRDVLSKGLRLA